MVEPLIKARLQLVGVKDTGSLESAGFSKSENRAFRLEQLKNFRSNSSLLNLLASRILGTAGRTALKVGGAVAGSTAGATAGVLTAAAVIPGDERLDPAKEAARREMNKLSEEEIRNKFALEEMRKQGIDPASDGLQTLSDGSIVLRDEFGNITQTFGKNIQVMDSFGDIVRWAGSAVGGAFNEVSKFLRGIMIPGFDELTRSVYNLNRAINSNVGGGLSPNFTTNTGSAVRVTPTGNVVGPNLPFPFGPNVFGINSANIRGGGQKSTK
jgi:hypothetical protein